MPANAEVRRLELGQLRWLEFVSLLEATTLVLLVGVAVPLKHLAHLATFETCQSAWRIEVSSAERQRLLRDSVAEDCRYQDPGTECHGLGELTAKIEDANARSPGATFRNDRFFEHHDKAVVEWTMLDGAGDEFARGASYVQFGLDGRLATMTGFYDPPSRPFGRS